MPDVGTTLDGFKLDHRSRCFGDARLNKMRVLSLLAAAGIAAGAFEPFYIRIFTLDRSRVAAMLT